MTTKNPDDLRGKGNIEAASSVIANWLEDEQPRARMARYRAAQMTTAGLLAPCLASGLPSENAVLLSQRMPKEYGALTYCWSRPSSSC